MRIVKNLLIGLVILWGLLALAVRSATPFITDFNDELAEFLSARLNLPVTIGRLEARWYAIAPLLELHDVVIGEGRNLLEIDRIYMDLDPGELVAGSTLDALRLTIDGMQLIVVREDTGQLHLEGIGLIRQEAGRSERVPPLPSRVRLLNTHVVWIDRKTGKPPFTIDNIDIVFNRDGTELDLRARLKTASGNADLSARLEGFLATRDWKGETYLKVEDLDVADLFAHYLPDVYGLDRLHLDLESWGQWQGAAPVANQGSFDLRDLSLHPRTVDAPALDLDRASAQFSMQRTNGDLRIGLKDLVLALADHTWPGSRLAFALTDRPDGSRRVRAAADYLRIEDVVRILQVRLPWSDLRLPLAHLQPHGEIRELALQGEVGGESPGWRVKADFEAVDTSPWGEIPGLSNLSGRLHGQQDHLVLELGSRDARVNFLRLFRDPLEFQELHGRVDLARAGGAWQLSSDHIAANTPHIDTRTRLFLQHQPDQPLFLDLQTDFSDGDASHALRYYPTSIMAKGVVAWLDASFKSGRVPAGTALVYGTLDEFPFEDPSSGTFQVVFDTDDLELDYLPGWPKLEHLDAHVRFHGNQLDIELDNARIYDSKVTDASAHIPSLNPAAPLQVVGSVYGPLANILRLLQEEALRGRFGDIAGPMRASGDAALQMKFAIPLADKLGYALQGQLLLAGARLSLPEWGFALDDIRGRLDFNLDGIAAQGVRARTLGSPIRVDVSPLADGTTRIRGRGNLTMKEIARQLPTLPLQAARGKSDFVIDVEIPPAGAKQERAGVLSVASDLRGISIDLPAPFEKATRQVRPLRVRLPIGDTQAAGILSYGGLLDARFSADGRRIDVLLGGGEARLAAEPGTRIRGHLGSVDLFDWGEALAGLSTGEAATPASLKLDLNVDHLRADNLGIRDLHLEAGLENGLWQGVVEAPNLAGSFSAAEELTQRPIQVDLQRLNVRLPLGEQDFHPSPLPDPDSGPDPSTLPGLVVNIADLRINDAHLGQLRLNAQRAPEGLRLTQFNLRGGQVELDSAGHWSRIGPRFQTEWGGRISSANLGDLLVDLGYSRQVDQAASALEFLMRWPGNPAQFHRATLTGSIGLDVGKGRIEELDPGVTRVVGLLNLNALTRRLRLDFSDIFEKGYTFDSMKGDFRFAHGTASTSNLRVDGPSGRIDLDGKADLINQTLDQHVSVTPRFDVTLPIAGTLAGGPVAGLAVLVVQKAMTKQVDNINRFEYRLTGRWDQPEVRQLDTGGTLSRILPPLTSGQEGKSSEPDDVQTGGEAAPAVANTTPPPTAATEAESGIAGAIEPAPRAQDSKPVTEEKSPATVPTTNRSAAESLLRILRESKPHGGDLPGTSE